MGRSSSKVEQNLMTIGIEFRMKGSAAKGQDEAEVKESRAFKQLKMDSLQLEKEHEGQVFYSFDKEQVKNASDLFFR